MARLRICCPGLRNKSQYFDQWLSSRWSISQSVFLLVVFVLSCSGKFVLGEVVYADGSSSERPMGSAGINYFSYGAVFSWKALWRFTGVSFLFTCASALVALSRWAGTSNVQIVTVGYLYLPLSVIMSYYVFNRNYGKLEWLTLGMMTMAVLTYVMLREQYRDLEESESNEPHPLVRLKSSFTPAGFGLLVTGVVLSVTGSIGAERIYKHKSRGLTWWQGRFYIMKAANPRERSTRAVPNGVGRKGSEEAMRKIGAEPVLGEAPVRTNSAEARVPFAADDGRTLEAYGVDRNSTIHLLHGQQGGADGPGAWKATEALRNPVHVRDVIRSTDRSVSQLEGLGTGSFDVLRQMCEDIRRPMQLMMTKMSKMLQVKIKEKVHIDVTALFLSLGLWGVSHLLVGRKDAFSDWFATWSSSPEWTWWQVLAVAIDVIQGWSAGLVTKEHSTTFKSILQTLCYIFTMLDPCLGNRWGFERRELPSIMLAAILVLSAIVFQLGRHNVKVLERAATLNTMEPLEPQPRAAPPKKKLVETLSTWKAACRKYVLILVYILSDAIRNLTLAKALSSTVINPSSMTLVVYIIGVVVASMLTLYVEGLKGLGLMPMFVATLFFLARLTYAANAECDEESLLQVKSEKVVVVSGCMSESNNSITEDMCTLAKQNFQEYTDYHGYKLVFFTQTPPGAEDRPPHWSKVLALLNVLEYEPEVDYVFWTDSDSLFVNQTISLMNYAPRGSSSMTFSGDYLCYFNSGHMLFKNDQWTRQFLKEVWDTYPSPLHLSNRSASLSGMNAALALIIGKLYTPVAAIGARWVLNKYYMWLEYVAIAILTLASMIFGYLQAFSPGSGPAWDGGMDSMRVAMLLVVGSAVASAFNSLLTERILKGDKARYHVQKVRLDTSCIVSALAFIPIIALISNRAQDNPWAVRPIDGAACPKESVCWATDGCSNPACECEIPSVLGVIILALVINTGYGWLPALGVLHR
eukprot:g23599.t1